jgi:hypothetical protein
MVNIAHKFHPPLSAVGVTSRLRSLTPVTGDLSVIVYNTQDMARSARVDQQAGRAYTLATIVLS